MAEKISSFEASLRSRGGIGAFFADGMTFKDFEAGIFSKRTIVVEDNDEMREKITTYFKNSALTTFCAQDYKTAQRLIYPRFANAAKFEYAIIDDKFPEERGKKPKFLCEKVVDELLKEHPGVRIFGYVENDKKIDTSKYIAIMRKDSATIENLYKRIIADAEMIRK